MTGRLVAALDRGPRTMRRLTPAALGLVVLLVVASALAPSSQPSRRPLAPVAGPTRARHTARGARPISPGELATARDTAARFLAGYLAFLYGRGSARSITAVTPEQRVQLSRVPGLVTLVERRRDPRVVSLTAVGQAPAAVLATALVADGGVTAYALRMVLRSGRDGWLVSSVDGG
ncbi:MAG: hypothetical protein JO325_06625 [Solirubrobacterales bacterium]|nr:hypothetical protein [Solirubrobacterales bacterium]